MRESSLKFLRHEIPIKSGNVTASSRYACHELVAGFGSAAGEVNNILLMYGYLVEIYEKVRTEFRKG